MLHTPIYTEAAGLRRRDRDWMTLGTLAVHMASPPDDPEWWSHIEDCEMLGGECWSDVLTSLQTDACYEAFLAGGAPAIWTWLGEAWLPGALR